MPYTIILHCRKCSAILLKDAVLPMGTELIIKCIKCEALHKIVVDQRNGLGMKIIT